MQYHPAIELARSRCAPIVHSGGLPDVLELVKAGGWLMWPIIACSVIAMAIVVERLWLYRKRRVLPANLVAQIWQLHQKNQLTAAHIQTVRKSSPLGRILAAGLMNR